MFPSHMRLFFFLWLCATGCFGQQVLDWRSGRLAVATGNYEWAEIAAERPSTQIGSIYLPSGRPASLHLPAPVPEALRVLLPPGKKDAAYALRVRVRELWFQERLAGKMVHGTLRVRLTFERKMEDSYLELTECTAGAEFSRSLSLEASYEIQLRTTLERCFREFTNWMKTHETTDDRLAHRVRVRFSDYVPKRAVGDSVFYSRNRPIRWSDFTGPARRRNPLYGAAIYTSFGYEANTRVENGTVWVDMTVKVFMLKNSSWTVETPDNLYALAHEQLHFDITYLVAERFKKALLAEDLPVEDYDSRIQYIFLDCFREMNRYQEQYDAETRHSIIKPEQARWAQKVADELREISGL